MRDADGKIGKTQTLPPVQSDSHLFGITHCRQSLPFRAGRIQNTDLVNLTIPDKVLPGCALPERLPSGHVSSSSSLLSPSQQHQRIVYSGTTGCRIVVAQRDCDAPASAADKTTTARRALPGQTHGVPERRAALEMNLCHDQKPQEKVNYKPNRDWRAHYMVAQEPGIGEVYRCKLCGKNYSKMIKIKNHVKNHFKDIKCDRCDLMFVSESKLKTHYVVHTKIRQHKCDFCGKDFYRKNNLTQHMKLHRNERNYACEFCGKTFTYRESMKSHIRNNHLRESPYECVPCTKKFVDPASLARHMAAEHKPQPPAVVVQQIEMMPVTVTVPVPPAPSMGGTIVRFDGSTVVTAADLGAFTVAGVFPTLGRQ